MDRKIVVLLIVCVFSLPLILSSDDDWPMFRHDPQHTGYNDCEMPDELELLWRYKTGSYVRSSPAVVNGKVYVGSWDSYVYCLDADTGRDLWRYKTEAGMDSSPAVVNGKVYVGSRDDYFYCLDADTGRELWRYKTGDTIISSPAVVNGKVYVGSCDNYFYCLDADTGRELWRYKTGASVWSSPAIANGKVYVGSNDTHLYCLDADTGRELWRYKTGETVHSSAVASGRVYVGSYDHYIYCFGRKEEGVIQVTFVAIDAFENSPVDGVQVRVKSVEKTTDTQGKATFTLQSGTYNVRVEKDNYDDGTGAGYTETITVGADTEETVKLYKKGYDLIIGTIHFDDGTVPYQVVAYQDGKTSPYQTTSPDTDGNFMMEVETGHTYEVGVVGYEDQKVKVVLSQKIDAPKTNPITINRAGYIFGVVSDELGKVVVGTTVKLYKQDGTLVTSVVSSNKGFVIENVTPGSYYIEVEMEGYEKFKSSIFNVKPKERYNIETLEIKSQKGILKVTVQDKDGNKLNASVKIKSNNEVVEEKTAENGEAEFQLNGGKYTVEVSLEGYKTETVDVDIFGGKTVTKSIILSPSQSNTLLYLGLFVAVIICILAIYQITKKKPEKAVIEKPREKKPEEKLKPPEKPPEKISLKLEKLLKEKEQWREKLEDLKENKENFIKRGVMTEEIYKQRYEEIMDNLVDIEDRIIKEKMKGGKKK